MYDCQVDACTDFSLSFFNTVGCAKALTGQLTAKPATEADTPCLEELAAYAGKLGYPVEQQATQLEIRGVTLLDALSINTRFAARLIICCDLRRSTPVTFG